MRMRPASIPSKPCSRELVTRFVTICSRGPGKLSSTIPRSTATSRRCCVCLSLGWSVDNTSSSAWRRSKLLRRMLVWSTATCLKLPIKSAARCEFFSTSAAASRQCAMKSSRAVRRSASPVSTWRPNSCTCSLSVDATVSELPSGVLSSCATPATRLPSDASFSVCTSWFIACSSWRISTRCASLSRSSAACARLRSSISRSICCLARCKSRVIFSFSRSAASSSRVRSRTRSSSRIVVWNRPKSERSLMLRSARLTSACTTLLSRAISARKLSTFSGGRSFVSGMSLLGRGADRDAGQGLVDVHTAVLLAVGSKAHRVVLVENFRDLVLQTLLGDLQVAQDAVAGEDHVRRANFRTDPGEGLLQVLDQVLPMRDAEHQPLVDGAIEGQAAVRVGLLDRAHVVRAVDHHNHRRGREARRRKLLHLDPDSPRVLFGRRQAVDFLDDAVRRVGFGDDQPLFIADEVLGLEDLERAGRRDHDQRGTVRVEGSVPVDPGALELQIVP